ncbi:tRNA uracil 4-sulfurtransferase ThiI [Bacillus chungangensis]|uniref:Probable tRNA sulfurtransferase n=1 Tax=Bacillus chungangensis TaxID=587633 RepID=A0ABT9WU50_9BACI|nr:tRNA uracil 4-sulfurtransferase ThiI [Bacillus chungangensis]MDQ0176826.1 thiamine biosynthesis protein ThiI [Bacillus chungangensis]
MKYDRILVRYGELSLKRKNRKKFVGKLTKNVRDALEAFPSVKIHADRERMFIHLHGEESAPIVECLKNIFGIQSISPVVKVDKDIDEIQKASLQLVQQFHQAGGSFKVVTKRSDKSFSLDTNGVNHAVGGYILKHIDTIHVNVKRPDIKLLVEIRHEGVFLSCETIQGAGGLPVGSSGKAMLMLSGGIDSPVAGYLTMKRGVELEVVHFHSPPFTSERAKQKVIDLARQLSFYNGKMTVHLVPFTKIQETIHQRIPSGYTMTSTRRMMLILADRIRAQHHGLAIATGENLGQVASQTLESLEAINDVTTTPILRPLISMDKNEIIAISQKINTYDISILPYEDCCTIFTPPAPKTKPKKEKIKAYESSIDFEALLEEALQSTQTMTVHINETAIDEFADLL